MADNVTTGLHDWRYQDNHVERILENSVYSAAHPDDCLVLVGPPRKNLLGATVAAGPGEATDSAGNIETNKLFAIGMLQQFSMNQSRGVSPMSAIGSGRHFFVSGKAPIQMSMARLLLNGKNLLRALAHNYGLLMGDGKAEELFNALDEKPAGRYDDGFMMNLDSELFMVPFGLMVVIRNKAHNQIGAFYVEVCLINTNGIQIVTGQPALMDNVSIIADRLRPIRMSEVSQNKTLLDQLIGKFQDNDDAG